MPGGNGGVGGTGAVGEDVPLGETGAARDGVTPNTAIHNSLAPA